MGVGGRCVVHEQVSGTISIRAGWPTVNRWNEDYSQSHDVDSLEPSLMIYYSDRRAKQLARPGYVPSPRRRSTRDDGIDKLGSGPRKACT